MDPDETLKDIRETVAALATNQVDDENREDAIEHLGRSVEALDQWLTNGGFLPAAWAANR